MGLAVCLLAATVNIHAQSATAQPVISAKLDASRHVLMLLQTGYGNRGVDTYVAGFMARWRQLGMSTESLHVEYLDLARTPGPQYRRHVRDMLLDKYAGKKIDLIVALQQPALDFLMQELKPLSPGAPVIAAIAAITPQMAATSGRHFLQQNVSVDFNGTLDIALRLLPDTHHVVLLGGAGAADLAVLREFQALAPRWQDRLSFEYTDQLTAEQINQRLAQLQRGSIVLQTVFNQDASGKAFDSPEMRVMFSRITPVPTFSLYAINLGIGDDVGGMLWANATEGESAAETGIALIQGRRQLTDAITPLPSKSVPMFNWAQLQRWGADTSVLPPASVIINKQPSLWEEHREVAISTTAALLLLLSLVLALALQNKQRRSAERKARESEASVKLLVEHAPEAIAVYDMDTRLCVDANKNAEILFACSRQELLQSRIGRFSAPDDEQPDGMPDTRVLARSIAMLEQGEHLVLERTIRPLSGKDVLCEVHILKLPTLAQRLLRVSYIDITERRENEDRIHRLAFYDPMTDLPNRRLLMDRLGMALHTAQRSNEFGAVLFVDLDHFKNVNDAHGHAVGDSLLQNVAARLRILLREEDTVARLGGDEFVILLPRLGTNRHDCGLVALGVAEKIRESLQQSVELEGRVCITGGSLGVTLLTPQGQSADDLLREADTAMYRAKEAGRNGIAFYEPEMQAEVQERLALEVDLKKAITDGQLSMHLQTQVNANGTACGAELLMRWQHPVRGFVSPAQFIPLAESTGLILALGDWVLTQGCQMLVTMARAGHDLPLSINISPRQFRDAGFVERVRQALDDSGAPAHKLIFEVTEGLLIEDMDKMLARMNALAGMGIRFSIDDFGTGYSSLAYLNRMPLYELKIDKSFVQGLPDDANARGIVQSILSMANHFSLHVVAEGVETQAQADYLVLNGCTTLQGYLFARPMSLENWLKQG
jgi:diguanylate cyclase (GGDEF)-like protein